MALNDLQCWFSGVACIRYASQLRNVTPMGPDHDEQRRGATTVHQQMTFAAIFSPGSVGLVPTLA